MTIDEKYDIFVKKYWEGVDEIKKPVKDVLLFCINVEHLLLKKNG